MPRPWEWDVELPAHPDIGQLKKLAKELVKVHASGDPRAIAFIQHHHPRWDGGAFRLSDAQWVLARWLGAPSWPTLVERLTGNRYPTQAPVLPVRNTVLFPGQRMPLHIGRKMSLSAVEASLAGDGYIACAAQRESGTELPVVDDIHAMGTLCRIVAAKRFPAEGEMRVRVEGVQRVSVENLAVREGHWVGNLRRLELPAAEEEVDAAWQAAVAQFELFARERDGIPHRAVWQVQQAGTARGAVALLLQHLHPLAVPMQQQVLEAADTAACLQTLVDAFKAA